MQHALGARDQLARASERPPRLAHLAKLGQRKGIGSLSGQSMCRERGGVASESRDRRWCACRRTLTARDSCSCRPVEQGRQLHGVLLVVLVRLVTTYTQQTPG